MTRILPYLDILKLVWPLALGMVNNAAMQFVDRAFLAAESMESLEAVLPASTLAWVFMSFFQSVVGYSGVFVAQYHGAGDALSARSSYRAGMWIAALSGLLLLALVPLGGIVFSAAAKSAAVAAKERAYFDIVLLGGFFVCGQTASAAYFTGRGLTRIVYWVNLAGNLLNIALDPLFIFTFGLGISGAAIATVVSQGLQLAVLAAFAARGANAERVPFLDMSSIARILKFGIHAGGYDTLNMLSFTIFVFVTGAMDPVDFAASNACFSVNYLVFAPMLGFSLGAQTLGGQSLGRGDHDGADVALKRTLLLGMAFVAIVCAAILALNGPILSLFSPGEPADAARFAKTGFSLLCFMSAWMLFDALDTILSGALKGAGDTRFVFFWMLFSAFAVWLPLVFAVKARGGGMCALWSTMVFYVVFISLGSLARWRFGKWRKIAMIQARGEAICENHADMI